MENELPMYILDVKKNKKLPKLEEEQAGNRAEDPVLTYLLFWVIIKQKAICNK